MSLHTPAQLPQTPPCQRPPSLQLHCACVTVLGTIAVGVGTATLSPSAALQLSPCTSFTHAERRLAADALINDSLVSEDDAGDESDPNGTTENGSLESQAGAEGVAGRLSFDYHKPAFPMDWRHDGITIFLAIFGLMIAASGGIGGGGILVPLFMLVLQFRPKHAIALSNFTIFGGALANTAANVRKRHPQLDRSLIDWDLILIMEPLTIFGAVFGSLLSKVLPNILLTVMLVLILAYMGQRTLKKGLKLFSEESKLLHKADSIEMLSPSSSSRALTTASHTSSEPVESSTDVSYLELQSDSESGPPQEMGTCPKVAALTLCFIGTCAVTVLKGGGNFPSPLGFDCGSSGFWLLYFGSLPWVLMFAAYFRCLLVGEYESKLRRGYVFLKGDVQWDSWNTIKYPIVCSLAGLMAGLFGVGGGIVKGPLMLEMGIVPSVASASAAAMILFTSAAASTSFVVFGLLHPVYGALFFALGFVSTVVGQYSVSILVERYNRQSPIVLSIGTVICLSSVLVLINTLVEIGGPEAASFFQAHGVCNTEA